MPDSQSQLPSESEVNPYQPPDDARATPATDREAEVAPSASRRFWEGRQALLKSLFFMRCYALVSALMALRGGYLLLTLYLGPERGLFASFGGAWRDDSWMAARFVLALLSLAVTLAFVYVVWRYSQELQQVAGRRQSDPTELCRQHLLCWKVAVGMLAAALLQQGVAYLHDRALTAEILAPFEDLGGRHN